MRTGVREPFFSESRRLVRDGKKPRDLSPQSSEPNPHFGAVDPTGSARYSAHKCRYKTEQEWYRRGKSLCLLLSETKAFSVDS